MDLGSVNVRAAAQMAESIIADTLQDNLPTAHVQLLIGVLRSIKEDLQERFIIVSPHLALVRLCTFVTFAEGCG